MRKTPEKYRKWLLAELPHLESQGVVNADERQRIGTHFEQLETESSNWVTLTLSSLGALLIGGGIILLFAHNWEILSRSTRAMLSVVPLALAAGVSWWSLGNSTKIREAAGLFHSLAIGASIALIGQTYHIPSNTPAFLLSWALLTIPLVFILSSNGALLVYLGLTVGWCGVAQAEYNHAIGFWPLIAPALIRVGSLIKKDRHAPGTILSLWGVLAALIIGISWSLEGTLPGVWIIVFSSLFSFVGLLGLALLPEQSGWRNPLTSTGVIGVTVLTYLFSWYEIWRNIGWSHLRHHSEHLPWGIWSDGIVALLFITGWALFAVRFFKPQFGPALILSVFPVFTVLGFTVSAALTDGPFMSGILFNIFMLLLGSAYLVEGCRKIRLRSVNYGMLILSVLILTRFFDGNFGFLARGVAFILIGIGFLAANLFISNRKRSRL